MSHFVLPDFDNLLKLAKEAPEQLEALRQQAVKAIIRSAPDDQKQRLRGLQFQIDGQRELSRNPVDACLRTSRMMMDSVMELQAAAQYQRQQPSNAVNKDPAQVIELFDCSAQTL